jgi:hypothetical protein
MILAGISQATLFTVPPQICIGLLLATLVMDIYVACKGGEKQNETTQKLSAVSFYLYGLLTGFLFGYGFTVLSDEEEKIAYAQILSAALIYTSAIFTVFSLFALLTTRRSVKFYFFKFLDYLRRITMFVFILKLIFLVYFI